MADDQAVPQPDDAVEAAARVIHDANCTCNDYEAHIAKPVRGDWPLRIAHAALAAAAPALRAQGAAAERERILTALEELDGQP